MEIVAQIDKGIFWVLLVGTMLLRVWALADCLARKSAAFPAAGKLTKPAWLALTIASTALGYFLGPLGFFSLITLVVSLVYLADVRPAVREITGGSRW